MVIATHNPGKFFEISRLLSPYDLKLLSAAELELAEPEELADDFSGNAEIKAKAAAAATGCWAVGDDSGLAVEALGGRPGIRSARWARQGGGWEAAMARIHEELTATAENPNPAAKFICVASLCRGDFIRSFYGEVKGKVVWPAGVSADGKGFGYDPIFVPEGDTRTFAEMPFVEKEAVSHRTEAFRALGELLPLKK